MVDGYTLSVSRLMESGGVVKGGTGCRRCKGQERFKSKPTGRKFRLQRVQLRKYARRKAGGSESSRAAGGVCREESTAASVCKAGAWSSTRARAGEGECVSWSREAERLKRWLPEEAQEPPVSARLWRHTQQRLFEEANCTQAAVEGVASGRGGAVRRRGGGGGERMGEGAGRQEVVVAASGGDDGVADPFEASEAWQPAGEQHQHQHQRRAPASSTNAPRLVRPGTTLLQSARARGSPVSPLHTFSNRTASGTAPQRHTQAAAQAYHSRACAASARATLAVVSTAVCLSLWRPAAV
ncbi:hypothetical protein BDV96DRAFT_599399 [Lophiotrema nucula]|uniref:Uncharacterized protein n=1 Tax=Lophiotrema nucula TaxID=690887 RepID=A0A6A5Z9U2_9PLEO|nr:hypothetical protein BDV96DRAFT_599399 [Lophiotrema nucula]